MVLVFYYCVSRLLQSKLPWATYMYYLVVQEPFRVSAGCQPCVCWGSGRCFDAHLEKEPLPNSLCGQNSSSLGGRVRPEFSCWTLVRSCPLCPGVPPLFAHTLATGPDTPLKPASGSLPSPVWKTAPYTAQQNCRRDIHLPPHLLLARSKSQILPTRQREGLCWV